MPTQKTEEPLERAPKKDTRWFSFVFAFFYLKFHYGKKITLFFVSLALPGTLSVGNSDIRPIHEGGTTRQEQATSRMTSQDAESSQRYAPF